MEVGSSGIGRKGGKWKVMDYEEIERVAKDGK